MVELTYDWRDQQGRKAIFFDYHSKTAIAHMFFESQMQYLSQKLIFHLPDHTEILRSDPYYKGVPDLVAPFQTDRHAYNS